MEGEGVVDGGKLFTLSVFFWGEKLSKGGSEGDEHEADCGEEEGGTGCSPLKRSKDLSKSNKPKLSITKKSPFSQNFTQNSQENKPFLVALIDKLSYNRICVNILGKCTLFRFYEFYETFKGVLKYAG